MRLNSSPGKALAVAVLIAADIAISLWLRIFGDKYSGKYSGTDHDSTGTMATQIVVCPLITSQPTDSAHRVKIYKPVV